MRAQSQSHIQLLATPVDCCMPGSSVPGIVPARKLEWVAISSSRGLPNPEIKPWSPALQADSLPAEPQGRPKKTRVSSLSLLQWIFPTQESNQGLLHGRRILYQLSSQGSPVSVEKVFKIKQNYRKYLYFLWLTVVEP